MGWKIVEIETGEHLSLFLNNLVVLQDNNKIIIPINDIDVLLINNFKAKMTIQLINCLSEHNVLTIVCDNKCLPSTNIVPIIGNFNTLKILDQQIQWTHLYKAKTWREIIYQKILGQAKLVKKLINDDQTSQELINLSTQIKEYDITNREGHAAKIYWHCLFGKNWKRHEDDYINKLLNYGYTILRSYFTRSIIKKGLDPRIALFHKSFHNYFALASDLMEPFRFLIDVIVYEISLKNEFNFYEHKQLLIESFNKKIKIQQKFQFITNAIDIFIDQIVAQNPVPEIEYDF